jgi:SAM-dependent methyltransferase
VDYDPIKDRLGGLFTRSKTSHRLFFRLLDLVFLRAWYVHRRLRALLAQIPASREVRILDAGTGFGQYAYFLLREFPNARITAVDVKQDYLDQAARFFRQVDMSHRIDFRLADLTQPLPEENHFDLALSVDVMEHIEDDVAVFRNFHRVLKPGGYVIVNTPSNLGGSGVTEQGEQSFIGEHVREGYAVDELEEKLRMGGLEPVLHEYTYGRYGSAGWRLLIQWPMKLLGRSWAFAPLLPLYYVPALPAGLLLNRLDLRQPNPRGTGLLVVARKPE